MAKSKGSKPFHLNKREYKIYLAVTAHHPLSERMKLFQNCYSSLLSAGKIICLYVDASSKDVVVPKKYIQDGKITLDISPRAINKFKWSENSMQFKAMFNGWPKKVKLPVSCIIRVYDKDTGLGFDIQPEEE